MKISEFTKELKRAGCYKIDEGTNHETWYSPITMKKFQLPRHYSKELGTGLENAIRVQSGVKNKH